MKKYANAMRSWAIFLLAGWTLAACRTAPAPAPAAPEVSLGGQRAVARQGMVAAAHPLAAQAGLEALRQGGNAVDAAVAAAFTVGVVEPMMSGIGGGGSMTIWLEADARAEHLEFYASAGADPDFARDDLPDSLVTPERRVAVPGSVAGLLAAHERYGTLPRRAVLEAAIRAARDGFFVHPLLARVIRESREKLTYDPEAAALFYPGGQPLQAGDRLVQPALAATLERIAQEGAGGFYAGPAAETLVAKLRAGGNPLTLDDLARFTPRWRRPLCGAFGGYTVLTAPPPLGGAEVLETLALLDAYDLPALGTPNEAAAALETLVDAIRIARADRVAYIGDPDDAAVPAVGLASVAFADERRALIGTAVPDTLAPGDPWDEERLPPPASCARLDPFAPTPFERPAPAADGAADDKDEGQTTHLSVVDRAGNAVSLTYTLGLYFGSGVYAGGAFLNSAANNFGDQPANRRGSYRTPRSTTAPTLVLDGDDVRLVVGAAGSGRIGPAVAQMILYTLRYGLDPGQSLRMPRLYPFVESREVRVEDGFSGEALAGLRARGYTLDVRPPLDLYFGGVHLVYAREDGWLVGAADPRRDGAALGY